MSIQAINAQSLKPAVSFKAETKPEQGEKPKSSVSKKVAWTAAGAVALAGITFAAIKMAKGKGSAKEIVEGINKAPVTAETVKTNVIKRQNHAKNKMVEMSKEKLKNNRAAKALQKEAAETAARLKKPFQEAQNVRFKNDATEIVENFEAMNKKAKTKGFIQSKYDHLDWDTAPMTRAEALAKKA